MTRATVECNCGQSLEVELDDVLMNEDWTPKDVTCPCGERYRVNLHMEILGKAQPSAKRE